MKIEAFFFKYKLEECGGVRAHIGKIKLYHQTGRGWAGKVNSNGVGVSSQPQRHKNIIIIFVLFIYSVFFF